MLILIYIIYSLLSGKYSSSYRLGIIIAGLDYLLEVSVGGLSRGAGDKYLNVPLPCSGCG